MNARRVPVQTANLPQREIDELGIAVDGIRIIGENTRLSHPASPGTGERVFSNPDLMVEDSALLAGGQGGVSGFKHVGGNQLEFSRFSHPLSLRDVRFLRCRGRRWDFVSAGSSIYNPLKETDDEAIVPLMGGIYVNGEDITQDEEKMRKLGLSFVKDDAGNDATHPAVVVGGRSVMWPYRCRLPALKTQAGGYACVTSGQMRDTVRKVGNHEAEAAYSKALEDLLRAEWGVANEGLSWEDYHRLHFAQIYIMEFIAQANQRGDEIGRVFPGVAVQVKGIGCHRYVYHFDRVEDDGTPTLQEGDVVLKSRKQSEQERMNLIMDHVFAQRPEYAGKSGILLDVHHEPFDNSPTGAIYSEQKGIERAQVLWGAGAEMSEIPTGTMRLLTRVQIDEAEGRPTRMVCEEIVVSQKVIFDDTHRLELLAKGPKTPEEPNDDFKKLIERDFGTYTDGNRDRFLQGLCRVIGKNMRVCLTKRLTVTNEQATADNLSIYGRIKDPQSFVDMVSRYQVRPLIRQWMTDAMDTYRAAGMPSDDFIKGEGLKAMAVSMLGKADGEAAYERVQAHIRGELKTEVKTEMSPASYATVELTRRIIQQGLRAEGKRLDRKALHRRLLSDAEFRKYSGLEGVGMKVMKGLKYGEFREFKCKIKTLQNPIWGSAATYTSESLYDHLQRAYIEYAALSDEPSMAHNLDQSLRPFIEGMPLEKIPQKKTK
ncbi:MAG: hypothetical protein V1875_05640 [Candidatus Altiarchaeota archaeon]